MKFNDLFLLLASGKLCNAFAVVKEKKETIKSA
jgi:hypothetical protein